MKQKTIDIPKDFPKKPNTTNAAKKFFDQKVRNYITKMAPFPPQK